MSKSTVALSNDEFFSAAYEELRRIARSRFGAQGGLTWNPTAIVNEVYVRLAESKRFQPASPEHLKHTVIRAMRYILVEAARRKNAERRGGGKAPVQRVPFDESAAQSAAFDPNEILSVDFALDELSRHSEFQARVFEYQFFGGLQVVEIAGMLGISEKKVQRSLRLARAFLTVALTGGKIE
ncbi:MAG: sigma-70 family RNA polymerase sigma factor [Acidobacteriaceae bacterium]|nr:sigma-70 family RNA polymerase sigma factor [Acidobacteriaceae bacterium]MBV9781395.1 sigma-70 family RNA polymerase sigma factor [Acidobacteriaceae bacterium]